MTRQTLPERRGATTIGLAWLGVPYDVTFGTFDDGRPSEVFISSIKSGSDVQVVAHDAAVLVSLSLQHGVALDVLRRAVSRDNGVPQSIVGKTLDAIAAELAP